MEDRNFKGLKRYEPLLQTICGMDDYHRLRRQEWEGCLGMACVLSVIEGTAPNMFSLSKHLDIPHDNSNLYHAFKRLRINGVFSGKYDVKNDIKLNGHASDSWLISASEIERNAWCNIAGIAGGFIGVKESQKKKVEEKVEDKK